MRGGDQAELANPPFDKRGQRIIDHRSIVNRLKLFAGDQCQWKETGARATGQNNAFHRARRIVAGRQNGKAKLAAVAGPRAVWGSQRPANGYHGQAYPWSLVHSDALRAPDGSRSSPVVM